MLIKLRSVSHLFGVGAVCSFLSICLLWAVYKLFSDYVDFVEIPFDMESFYMPVFWGGVVACLGLLRLKMSMRVQAYVSGVLAAFALCVEKFSWAASLLEGKINLENLLRFDVFSLICLFTLCWGYLYRQLVEGF